MRRNVVIVATPGEYNYIITYREDDKVMTSSICATQAVMVHQINRWIIDGRLPNK